MIYANIQVEQNQSKHTLNSFYMWRQSEYEHLFLHVFNFLAWKAGTFDLIILFVAILVVTATLLRIKNKIKKSI